VYGNRRCATHSFATPDYVAPVEVEALPVSVEGEEPFTHEYTFCNRCDQEFQVDDGTCPNCGIDLILPENHRIRVEHREWVARLDAMRIECDSCGDVNVSPLDLTQVSSTDGESTHMLCPNCNQVPPDATSGKEWTHTEYCYYVDCLGFELPITVYGLDVAKTLIPTYKRGGTLYLFCDACEDIAISTGEYYRSPSESFTNCGNIRVGE